jgi:sporulation protein YlmC with PRC-barrel domain
MKATNRFAIMAAVTAMTVGAPSLRADDLQQKAKIGDTEAQVNVDVNKNKEAGRYTATESRYERHMGVSDAHKASSIVGMKIKNHAGETLGDIQDLVVDMQSGRISYAVLGVGGFLGVGEKYIAVPPSAFAIGADEKTLVLNADKAKIQAAPGFVKNNWPDFRNPDFGGAGFWDLHRDSSVGGSSGVTTGTDRSSTSRDLNKLDKADRDLNKSSSDRLNP